MTPADLWKQLRSADPSTREVLVDEGLAAMDAAPSVEERVKWMEALRESGSERARTRFVGFLDDETNAEQLVDDRPDSNVYVPAYRARDCLHHATVPVLSALLGMYERGNASTRERVLGLFAAAPVSDLLFAELSGLNTAAAGAARAALRPSTTTQAKLDVDLARTLIHHARRHTLSLVDAALTQELWEIAKWSKAEHRGRAFELLLRQPRAHFASLRGEIQSAVALGDLDPFVRMNARLLAYVDATSAG